METPAPVNRDVSAIGAGAVDRVLPLDKIPAELIRLVTKPKSVRRPTRIEQSEGGVVSPTATAL